MSVYNIRYMKFFLNKLDWTADNFRPWLRLRKWYPGNRRGMGSMFFFHARSTFPRYQPGARVLYTPLP